ncbi:MAG: hemerythrin family protein [Oscillospiraceae bacterium]|nr:hemerythrin family protein [Oscillospiraceae bacterium]
MLWKDSLKIGVEKIDEQHKTLFAQANQLASSLDYGREYQKEKAISTIVFLKEYAVTHFADEEEYQLSINDANYTEHKKLHDQFVVTVLKHEKKMLASDFAYADVCEFTGTLLAWLTYHVADVDQKIGKAAAEKSADDSYADIICECFRDVISIEIDADKDSIVKVEEHNEAFDNSVIVRHPFTHTIKGHVVFDFSVPFVHELLNKMLYSLIGISPAETEIGDFEKALLLQISTTIVENIYRRLNDRSEVNDIDISIAGTHETQPNDKISFDTGIGIVEVGLTIT